MYQCPKCHMQGISTIAIYSMGKRMAVRCKSCGTPSYRKLPFAIEVVLSFILTLLGAMMILAKGEPMLFVAWLLGILGVMLLTSHLFGKMTLFETPQS